MDWLYSKNPVAYEHAVFEMEKRAANIRAGTENEAVWLLEHPPLYTAGTSAKETDLLNAALPNSLPVFQTGRGGQYTYHGPGQRIAYVMVDLQKRGGDVRKYVFDLERWIIDSLADLDVIGERREGRIGIWVTQNLVENKIAALSSSREAVGQNMNDGAPREAKIAAIGVRVKSGVTFHGISINVDPDLSHYGGIVPCGISEHGVTSLRALKNAATMEDLDAVLKKNFAKIF